MKFFFGYWHLTCHGVLIVVISGEMLQKGGGRVPAASRPVEFGQSLDATVDIPLDNMNVMTLRFLNSETFLT